MYFWLFLLSIEHFHQNLAQFSVFSLTWMGFFFFFYLFIMLQERNLFEANPNCSLNLIVSAVLVVDHCQLVGQFRCSSRKQKEKKKPKKLQLTSGGLPISRGALPRGVVFHICQRANGQIIIVSIRAANVIPLVYELRDSVGQLFMYN